MLDTQRYYKILDLEPGASPEDVHQGYIDLTWVWHPDRFVGHPRLQQKAHHKLQEINEAHAQLRFLHTATRRKDYSTKAESKVSSPPQAQTSSENLEQPTANQTKREDTRKTVTDCKPNFKPNHRQLDEWLD